MAIQINASSSIRNLAMVQGLAALGHDVTILTGNYDKNHVSYDTDLEPQNVCKKYILVGGIQKIASVGRKFKKLEFLRKFVWKTMDQINVYDNLKGIVNCMDQYPITDEMYDLIISSSDPKSSHLFIYELYNKGNLVNTPWVQIWGDPFAADITKNNFFYKLRAKKEEKKLLNKPDKIFYVSKFTADLQRIKYKEFANKMFFLPPSYVTEDSSMPQTSKQPLILAYCGNYSLKARNINPFYQAVQSENYITYIMGNGDAKITEKDNIFLKKRNSFSEIKKVEHKADVLVYICNSSGTQIPGKIYQYAGTCKYILFILDGEVEKIQEYFQRFNRFVFCRNEKEDIKRALKEIADGNYRETRFIVQEFSSAHIAEEFLKLCIKD